MSPARRDVRAVLCLAALSVVVITGCAAAPAGAGSAPRSERSTGVLTWQEMEGAQLGGGLLVDAIRHLRPAFLVPRGGADRGGDAAEIQVSVNDGIPGSMATLHDLSARLVASVALLSPGEAQVRFGMRESLGPVLLVRLK